MHHHPFGFTFDEERAAGLRENARELGIVSVISALLTGIAVAIFALTLLVGPADAKASDPRHPSLEQNSYSARSHRAQRVHHRARHAHHTARHHRRDRSPTLDANGNRSGLIHVETAANIAITVASSFAPKIQGFIADLVAHGYHPHQIHCFAQGGHVRGSLHYRGEACDFDQRGWGLTARAMYHVAALAQQHGLRDGCTFRDCGHIDSGHALARLPWPRTLSARSHHRRVAMIGR